MNQVIHAKTFFQNCISLEDPLHAPWEIACNGFLPLYLRVLTKLWSAPTFWTFDGQLPLKSVDDHIGTWSVTPKDTSDTKETQIFCTVTEGSLSLCTFGGLLDLCSGLLLGHIQLSPAQHMPQVELMDRFVIGDHFGILWKHLQTKTSTERNLKVTRFMRKTHPNPQVSPEFCQLRVEFCDGWWPEVSAISTSKRRAPRHFCRLNYPQIARNHATRWFWMIMGWFVMVLQCFIVF